MSFQVTPETHGATGDLLQDDAAAVTASFNEAVSIGRSVDASGRYRLDSKVVVDVGSGDHITIRGGGPSSSTFFVHNGDGGLDIGNTSQRQNTIHLEDMHFKPGLVDSGVPFVLSRRAGGLDLDRAITIRDVHVGPENEGDAQDNEDFSNGPSISGSFRALVDSLTISSRAATAKWGHIFDVSEIYKLNINDSELNVSGAQGSGGGALIGLKSHGTNQEGFIASKTTVNGAGVGLSFIRDNREPGFVWIGGHFNSEEVNAHFDGVKNGIMIGTLLFGPENVPTDSSGEDVQGFEFVDIRLVNASEMTFTDLDFRQGLRRGDGSPGSRRHLVIEPRDGGIVEGIDFEVKHMTGSSDVPPIYIGVGPKGEKPKGITIRLPFYSVNRDNASYPDQLVELHPDVDPEEVRIITADGPVSYDQSNASGPTSMLRRFIAAISNGAALGRQIFTGTNDAGADVAYARRRVKAEKVANGAECGQIDDFVIIDGTDRKGVKLSKPANVGESIQSIGILEASGYTVRRLKVTEVPDGSGGTIEVLSLV